MGHIETNVFQVLNLSKLESQYRRYRIKGLTSGHVDFDRIVQVLIRDLSQRLKSPVTVAEDDGELYLIVPVDSGNPPSPFQVSNTTVYLEPTSDVTTLDYAKPTPETEQICLRFLQFMINGYFYQDRRYWQPSSGYPQFEREPILTKAGIDVYRGYSSRVVYSETSGFGVCVDVTHKYVSHDPFPAGLTQNAFASLRGTRCVYHYGLAWYEIRPMFYSDLTVSEQLLKLDDHGATSLFDFIMNNAPKPFPKDVANLSPDSLAVGYLTSNGEARHAAAGLCYPVVGTADPRVRRIHRDTILPPDQRRSLIKAFVRNSLAGIDNANLKVRVSSDAVTVPKRVFLPPDVEFGNGVVLSVRGSKDSSYVGLENLGKERLGALRDPKIGPYSRKPLDRQYFVVPRSVADSYGPTFIADLEAEVNSLYDQEVPYAPTIIKYEDRVDKTFPAQASAVLGAVEAAGPEPGYGIVMIHEVGRGRGEHDQLAAMIMTKLREQGLFVSIIHTTVPGESYRLNQHASNGPAYTAIPQKRSRLNGYLRNVAINKVLLTNERWPFVLSTPLNADLTIALDVQNNTACFTLLGKSGPSIRTEISHSRDKEKLSQAHVKKVLLDILRQETSLGIDEVENIMLLRDGQLFRSEINGVKDAIATLHDEGLMNGRSVSFVEIPKTSAVSFRLFEVETQHGGNERVENPGLGQYHVLNGRSGYICSTGREYLRQGTAQPLSVRYVEGAMPFDRVLEDVYGQTCLALTRPEGCSRLPFSLRLTDIRLAEHAGDYDQDALAFGENLDSENTRNYESYEEGRIE